MNTFSAKPPDPEPKFDKSSGGVVAVGMRESNFCGEIEVSGEPESVSIWNKPRSNRA